MKCLYAPLLARASFRSAEQKFALLSAKFRQSAILCRKTVISQLHEVKLLDQNIYFLLSTGREAYSHKDRGVADAIAMKRGINKTSGTLLRPAAYAAVGALLLSPVLVPAFAAQFQSADSVSGLASWASHFTPAGVDSRLAERMRSKAARSTAFPFTPAGLNSRGSNTLTVAARADGSNAVSVRSAMAQLETGSGTSLRLNNSNYQLTTARGWQAFTLPSTSVEQPRLSDMLGKGTFRLDDNAKKKPSRFGTDLKVASPRGAAPSLRGNEAAAGDYSVNVGGSFRVAKGVDVTAGVRYSRDSDHVDPAIAAKADNEAVYVGTKIKF